MVRDVCAQLFRPQTPPLDHLAEIRPPVGDVPSLGNLPDGRIGTKFSPHEARRLQVVSKAPPRRAGPENPNLGPIRAPRPVSGPKAFRLQLPYPAGSLKVEMLWDVA